MKIILCGYNWAGCRALDILLNAGHNVYVFTHESPSYIPSLYNYCLEKGVFVTYESINSSKINFTPDFICSIYYRYIIKKIILELVDYKAINLHPSILPKYRGCSSLTWAMISGETEVGFTYHYIDPEIDKGKIVLQKKLPLYRYENQTNIYQRVMFEALKYFNEAFNLMINDYPGIEQKGEASYYKRGAPENGEINETWPEAKVKLFINAMINPPLPYAKYKGIEIKKLEDYLNAKNENRN